MSNPTLTPTEQNELFRAMKAGDTSARDRIIMSNRGLALYIASKIWRTFSRDIKAWISEDDLQQESLIVLIRAVDYFDPDQDTKFAAYATRALKANLHDFVSRHLRRLSIAPETDDATLPLLPDPRPADPADLAIQNETQNMLTRLNDKESAVIKMRFGFHSGTSEAYRTIAKTFNVSHETVRTWETQAIRKLRSIYRHETNP